MRGYEIYVFIAIYDIFYLLSRAYKGDLGNKICARDTEGEFLQLNCYGESFFSLRVTWKRTVNRPAGRRKDASKKRIFIVVAPSPLRRITLALSVARISIDFTVDAD